MEASAPEPQSEPHPSPSEGKDGVVQPQKVTHTSPPYWQHNRGASYATVASLDLAPRITLQDHTDIYSDTIGALWAKAIAVKDYVIIRGNVTGIGAYVVYNCTVQTLDGGPMKIRKRYSEFDDLREKLAAAFPQSTDTSLPPLPPKSVIYKFRAKFLEKRREGLSYFLNCVMLNPEYASSAIVKDFIFAHDS